MRRIAIPQMALSLTLAVLSALVLIGINETGYRESNRALEEISQAQSARFTLGALTQNILDAETGQRGYLLTGEARYREPYDSAVKEIAGNLATLHALYAGHAYERARLTLLVEHVTRKLAEMDMSVRLRESGAEDAWQFVMHTEVGREEMNAIRAQMNELFRISNTLLAQGQRQVSTSLQLARAGIAVVALAGLLAFGLYLRQTHALRSAGERQQLALQRERNALEHEVSERTATLTELATHLQNVRETERGFLARELHDELGSLLTAAKLDVARLKSRLGDSPEATHRLQHLTELLNSGITLKRRIIEDLRPSSLSSLGLSASLEILAREFSDQSGINVEIAVEPVLLDESRQLTVYRMVQEGLTNIGKYAQASEANIVLKNYETHVIVEVSDNGKGFDPQAVEPSTHGLAGMRHRVKAASGKLTVISAIGEGTLIRAMLPVQT